ncbi:hypothetical protein K431DRAFT_322331 [Polychaeton citri CBS 116435]|uniref:Wax synthase domain-containing protein n=1 Tax=Polychaeton citri CBS 116435 TaxID=1314669 RepID=A0A9P4UMA3_9PEZI|nr:hypothetical protein K431DRAFT_322331 [Polychaeton citri CBS 116435]
MFNPVPDFLVHAFKSTFTAEPRPGLQPIPGTKPVTIDALICPPLVYYVALLFLAPPPPLTVATRGITVLRNVLAVVAAYLFFRLPLAYHVPQSIGLTYQLGLVGLYGGCRVLDAFFISYYGFGHVPRRVTYVHYQRPSSPAKKAEIKPWTDGGDNSMMRRPSLPPASDSNPGNQATDSMLSGPGSRRPSFAKRISQSDLVENMTNESYSDLVQRVFKGPDPIPVIETAQTESGYPHSFFDRAAWALELELSMRGVGFTWTTADVRHTRKTWLPTPSNRVHSILVNVAPVLVVSWAVIKSVYTKYIMPSELENIQSPFDTLVPLPIQLALTAALGSFLMASFSFAHSMFAILLSPLAPSTLAFFPPLYTTRVWDITSARAFWSFGWHRLFARLFLVWGVWPGEWVERKLTGKTADQPADVGKVIGGFLSSAFVHSFAVRGTLGGDWTLAAGEAKFFAINGFCVIFEEGVRKVVKRWRRSNAWPMVQPWDAWVGRFWWIGVLLVSGRNFARGWTKAGLVREMAFM